VRPKVIASLGTFATRLLSGREHGITRVHGTEQQVTLAGRAVTLYPLYHPAAALYTPAMLRVLEEDFARIPELLGRPSPAPAPSGGPRPAVAADLTSEPVQLGLF
jgi:DNA polymerase